VERVDKVIPHVLLRFAALRIVTLYERYFDPLAILEEPEEGDWRSDLRHRSNFR
jgi:hypothetical protein